VVAQFSGLRNTNKTVHRILLSCSEIKMKTPDHVELSSLAKAAGPQLTRAELDTHKILREMTSIVRQIADTPASVRMERTRKALQAIGGVSAIEPRRAAIWSRARLPLRRIACMSANIDKERANDALAKFNAFERTRIWTALDDLIDGLIEIQKCMSSSTIEVPEITK
jgi:hypothetical protein